MTGVEIISLAGSAASTLKTAAEALGKLRDKPSGDASGDVMAEAQKLVIAAQSEVLRLQEAVFQLHQQKAELGDKYTKVLGENAELRDRLRAEQTRSSEREQYEHKKVGNSWVVVTKGEEEPYYCPTCYGKDSMTVLSPLPSVFARRAGTTHMCSICKSTFDLRR